METNKTKKVYDLEERTFKFSEAIRRLLGKLKMNMLNTDDIKQLIRSSGSVGANYIEANESLGKKDFSMRVKICRKEAKESIYWLKLIDFGILYSERDILIQECQELMRIFGAILEKTKQPL